MAFDPSKIYMAVPNYLVDKIFYKASGSQNVSGRNPSASPPTQYTIPQDKGQPFFCQMLISTDQQTWYTPTFPPFAYNSTYALYLPTFYGGVATDENNVYVYLSSTETDRTIYYKIVGFSIG